MADDLEGNQAARALEPSVAINGLLHILLTIPQLPDSFAMDVESKLPCVFTIVGGRPPSSQGVPDPAPASRAAGRTAPTPAPGRDGRPAPPPDDRSPIYVEESQQLISGGASQGETDVETTTDAESGALALAASGHRGDDASGERPFKAARLEQTPGDIGRAAEPDIPGAPGGFNQWMGPAWAGPDIKIEILH